MVGKNWSLQDRVDEHSRYLFPLRLNFYLPLHRYYPEAWCRCFVKNCLPRSIGSKFVLCHYSYQFFSGWIGKCSPKRFFSFSLSSAYSTGKMISNDGWKNTFDTFLEDQIVTSDDIPETHLVFFRMLQIFYLLGQSGKTFWHASVVQCTHEKCQLIPFQRFSNLL